MIHTQTCTQDVDLSKASIGKNDLYAQVTNTILAKLEEGTVPWLKSWSNGIPASIKGHDYRGINILLVGFKDYPSRYWITFKQLDDMGGRLIFEERKKHTPIVFSKRRSEEEIEKLKVKYGRDDVAPFHLFIHRVWNITQCVGIQAPANDVERFANSPIEAAERIVREMPNPPTLYHRTAAMGRAGYSPTKDYVAIPPIDRFHSAEAYYATLFHEYIHSTGHPSRLDRPQVTLKEFYGKETDADCYSKEELIAELGSSFLCALCGFGERVIENQAAYVQGWMKWLQNDPRALMEAASAAQKAVDYVLQTKFEKEGE